MELSALLLAALAAGLLGSLHCAAMCGPLALAGASSGGRPTLRGATAYLGGRFASYAAVGALMGALGQHALCRLPVAHAQLAAVVLVAGAAAWRGIGLLLARRRRPSASSSSPTVRLGTRAPRPSLYARLLARLPRRGFALGLATGVLPCGMLLPAWALAAGSTRPELGALTMLAFATASLPGLVFPLAGARLFRQLGRRLPPSVHGMAWCALAVWIALRPLLAHAHHHH